jgi:hypothetical protein
LENNGWGRPEGVDGQAAKGAASGFALHYDAWGRLVLTDASGRQHVGVQPVRAFPISDPAHGLAICDADGRELVWIDTLDKLPAALRQLLEEDLARRQLMPLILRVVKISSPTEPSEWEVETDRGPTRLVLSSEEDVRPLSGNRVLVIDAYGIRYLIPDRGALDGASQRLLERYL